MAGDYRRVELATEARPYHDTEPEADYWAQYSVPFHSQQSSSVTCIDFSATAPYDLCATASVRLSILDGRTLDPKRAISKFVSQAFSGRWRRDGKLIVSGCEDSIVRIFDAASRAEMRALRGHKGAVRATRFSPDRPTVVSGGDDGVVCEWDVPTGECLARVESAHSDSIRGVEPSPASAGVWASCGYDGLVRVWDVRAKRSVVAAPLDHGAPVEALLFFPGGNALVSAGGNRLRVWDILGGGRVLAEVANHQKTVTSLCLDSTGTRLLSGGADRLIKVVDVQSYRVLHTIAHHAPVLSLAMSPDGTKLAVGASDGDLCVLSRPEESAQVPRARNRSSAARANRRSEAGTVRYFLRGPEEKAKAKDGEDDEEDAMDEEDDEKQKRRLQKYDSKLRKFRYKEALDAALEQGVRTEATVGLLRELMHRGGLEIALRGRDEAALEPLFVFLVNHATEPQHSQFLLPIAKVVLQEYAGVVGRSMRIEELCRKLQARLHRELALQESMLRLMGALDLLVASSEPSLPNNAPETPATPSL